MTRDPIDLLLRLGYLEGTVRLHGAYERVVFRHKDGTPVLSDRAGLLVQRLECLNEEEAAEDSPETIGAFLQKVRSGRGMREKDLCLTLGLSKEEYRRLEEDRISPVDMGVEFWVRFMRSFRMAGGLLCGMIRSTQYTLWESGEQRVTFARSKRGDPQHDRLAKKRRREALRELSKAEPGSAAGDGLRRLEELTQSLMKGGESR